MAATLVRKVQLKLTADDGDTEAKLDSISRKADELAEKHPDLKVRIDTAAASAKLAVLRKELKSTDDQGASFRERASGIGQALNNMTLGLPSGIGEMTLFQKVIAGLNLATGLGEPLVAALTVTLGGLTSGLVAGGAGLGVFGAVADSVWSQYSGNISAAAAAQEKIASGDTGAKLAADNKALAASFKGLNGNVLLMVMGAANAETSWHSFTSGAAQGVAGVLAPALQLVPGLLGQAQKFLPPVEKSLGGIVKMVGGQLGGSGFSSFISMLAANSGPAISRLGGAIDHIVVGLGGIIRAFMPFAQEMLGGLDKITGKFAAWGSTLTGHSGFQSLISMFRQDGPLLAGVLKNLGGAVKNVVSDMAGLSTFSNSKMLLQMAGPLSSLIKAISGHPDLVNLALWGYTAYGGLSKAHSGLVSVKAGFDGLKAAKKDLSDFTAGFADSKKAADEATGAWGTWGGKASTTLGSIKSMAQQAAVKMGLLKATTVEATGATEGEEGAQEGLNTVMSLNPIGLIVIAIAALVVAFVELWKHSAAFRDFWKAAWKDIRAIAVDAWHFIDNDMIHPLMSGIDKLVGFVKDHWRTLAVILATVLLGPVGGLVVFIATHWAEFRRITGEVTDDVTGFFERLPGRIMSALARLPGLMLSAGRNIVSMLVSGIESMASAPAHAVESIVGDVRNFLPFSPAKRGPLSGAGSPDIAGKKISLMLGQGMTAGRGYVESAAAQLGKAAQIGAAAGHPAYAGAGGAAAGGPLELRWVGGSADQALITLLKRHIRVTGGDPTVLGR